MSPGSPRPAARPGQSRERWIGVAIDDVFLPNWDKDPSRQTVKIQPEDVDALLAAQERYSRMLAPDRFRFLLGFCSGWYGRIADRCFDDAAGDRALVRHREAFEWFDHLPGHQVACNYSEDELVAFMHQSRQWAKDHDVLPFTSRFAVSPAHKGIHPIYDPVYRAWRAVWNVSCSATPGVDRGFEHLGIKVAPRYNIGLWASQHGRDQLAPGQNVIASAEGGRLFKKVVQSPVLLIVSHQANYARDRLALVLLDRLLAHLVDRTDFRLRTGPHEELVEQHFRLENGDRMS